MRRLFFGRGAEAVGLFLFVEGVNNARHIVLLKVIFSVVLVEFDGRGDEVGLGGARGSDRAVGVGKEVIAVVEKIEKYVGTFSIIREACLFPTSFGTDRSRA